MTARDTILAMGCLVFLMFSLCGNAFAENDGEWCSGVKVLGAGATTNSKVINVQHTRTDCGGEWPPNTPRWFILDDSQLNANAMLAAALTAQVTGKTMVLIAKDRLFNEWNVLQYVSILSD